MVTMVPRSSPLRTVKTAQKRSPPEAAASEAQERRTQPAWEAFTS